MWTNCPFGSIFDTVLEISTTRLRVRPNDSNRKMKRTTTVPPNATENQYVSTVHVSLALGVGVSTVKRWVDEGILPAHRTAGGHRKILLADVLRLVREGNLPRADLSRLVPQFRRANPDDHTKLIPELTEAIDGTDADRIRSILHGTYRAGTPIESIADRLIGPAMLRVGQEWSLGRIDVHHEHRITQVVVSALYEMKSFMRPNAERDRPVAIGCALENDHYILPTLLAKMTLLDSGWNAINLGPHTPIFALQTAMEKWSPQLIWISMTHFDPAERFESEYCEFFQRAEERGIAVAIGGQALTESLLAKLPHTAFGEGMVSLATFARTIFRRRARPKRGRPSTEDKTNRVPRRLKK